MTVALVGGCSGVGNWSIDWDSDANDTLVSSPYAGNYSVTYGSHGTYTITLTYTCLGHSETTASLDVNTNFENTPTPTATATDLPPLSASWKGNTPNWTANNRIFFEVSANHPSASAVCYIPGDSINCPPDTLVNLASGVASGCGSLNVRAEVTAGDESFTLQGTAARPCPTNTPLPTNTLSPPQLTAIAIANLQTSAPRTRATATATAPYLYPTQDHSGLPAGATIESDSPWIAFREVSGAAIGDPTVRDNAMSAVDVWGPLGVDAQVCLPGSGSLILLDAAYSPRRPVWLNSQHRNGKTCAQLNRAGTVALMPASLTATPTGQPTGTATPNPHLVADSLDQRRLLVGCRVTASQLLNFRQEPAGSILSLYLGGSAAIARTDNWFQVMYLGNIGWISAHYVTTDGDCD